MRSRIRMLSAATAVLSVAALCTGLSAADTASADTALASLTGTADAAGGGTVVLMVEYPTEYDADGLPTTLTDIPVAQSTVTSDGSFNVALPDTATVRDAASNGWVTTVTEVAKGDQFSINHTPVLLTPEDDTAGSTDEAVPVGGTVNEGQAPAMITASTNVENGIMNGVAPHATGDVVVPQDNTVCQWHRLSTQELGNRIGELHVADVSGASGTFLYHTKADSHFEIGVSVSKGAYNASGHGSVTNSLSTDADYTQGPDHKSYANDHMIWGRYVNNGAATCTGVMHKVQALRSTGDAYTGPNTPGASPWGTCHGDSHGYNTVNANGNWGMDRATAHEYGVVSDAYGFNAGGHTGYTSGIHVTMHAKANRTYVCGDRTPPNMSIVYNKKW